MKSRIQFFPPIPGGQIPVIAIVCSMLFLAACSSGKSGDYISDTATSDTSIVADSISTDAGQDTSLQGISTDTGTLSTGSTPR